MRPWIDQLKEGTNMFFQRVKTAGIAHNAYLLGTEGVGILVDPRRDVTEYLDLARKNKLEIQFVLETHRHEDFVVGSAELQKLARVKVVASNHEFFGNADIKMAHRERKEIGGLIFECLYTPGHTPESVSFAVYFKERPGVAWAVFTGDALFIGEAGRTDLPDPRKTAENAAVLYDSVQQHILPLGDQTLLYPAHGSGSVCGGNIADHDESTIGIERTYNPAFVCSKEEFIQKKLKERIPRPPYFTLMEKLNLSGGISLPGPPQMIPVLGPENFQRRAADGIVIDTRLPESFAGGHIRGSYSIWLAGLAVFSGWIADHKLPVFLVIERPDDLQSAFLHLTRVGVDNVAGVLAGGFEAWRDAGLPIQMSGTISAMSERLWSGQLEILDVRDITEYEKGHIRGAKHAYVGFLPEMDGKISNADVDKAIAVTCSVGHRASLAASILLRRGFKNVVNVIGGMTAVMKVGKPLVDGPDIENTLDAEIVERQAGGFQSCSGDGVSA